MNIDLHSHSTASDGSYSSSELVAFAKQQNLSMLAITDHDTMAGYLSVCHQATDIRLIAGVEISCRHMLMGSYNKKSYNKNCPNTEQIIHVVGLAVQDTAIMQEALQAIQQSRAVRAKQMIAKLAVLLDKDAEQLWHSALQKVAGNANALGRVHIAQVLYDLGAIKTIKDAFDKYLADGKCAYVPLDTPTMAMVVALIHRCGGFAVLAHPTRYDLSATRVRRLIADFATMGGDGCELPALDEPKSTRQMIDRAIAEHNLLVSVGSDFHGTTMPWRQLGHVPTPNVEQVGIWERFN